MRDYGHGAWPNRRCRAVLTAAIVALLGVSVGAAPIGTGDGILVLDFSDVDGRLQSVTVDDESLALLPAEIGGLLLRVGEIVAPPVLQALDFATDGGPWTIARNENWEATGDWATWQAAGGPDGSAYLTLGDGATVGAGIALADPIDPDGAGRVAISWQARVADTATAQILAVRVYDAGGADITSPSLAPGAWSWSGTSRAHVRYGIVCEEPDEWESFTFDYALPPGAASVGVSLRYWTGGDGLVDIDDLEVAGDAIVWEEYPVLGPWAAQSDGSHLQSATIAAANLQVDLTAREEDDRIDFRLDLEAIDPLAADVPVVARWSLPVDPTGWQWHDDIGAARPIVGEVQNSFDLAGRPASLYPFCTIDDGAHAVALSAPPGNVTAQRFVADEGAGLSTIWEIGLSSITDKIGPGRASVGFSIWSHEPEWGFRAAAEKYIALNADAFVRRPIRHGSWQYPVATSLVPDPLDFGWAYYETRPLSEEERLYTQSLGIGVYHYVEPWLAWLRWGPDGEKPSIAERVARLEEWAAAPPTFVEWIDAPGADDHGYLRMGNGSAVGVGMAMASPTAAAPGDTLNVRWQARAADAATSQIVGVRVYDAGGADMTASTPAPPGWFYTSVSAAHAAVGFTVAVVDTWEQFELTYAVPAGAAAIRLSVRHWTGGDHFLDLDNVIVYNDNAGAAIYENNFVSGLGDAVSAYNADWENSEISLEWLRAPRHEAAAAVLASSPYGIDRKPLIDFHPYLWHEWTEGFRDQAWPVVSDPDIPGSTYSIYSDYWINDELDEIEGIYVDSVLATGSVGGWENYRRDHIRWTDHPSAFSWQTGVAVQLATQAHAEVVAWIEDETRALGKHLMLNLFPESSRYFAHMTDIAGSEIFTAGPEDAWKSRLRRTMAGPKVVTNLLQFEWGREEFITAEEMESYLRSQLFWGFFPGVTVGGGPLIGVGPNRYFLNPQVYERDRPLFKLYHPVIERLSEAGWEPVTGARLVGGEVERFGDFARGDIVYFTIRGEDGEPIQASIDVDVAEIGGGELDWAATELLTGANVYPTRTSAADPLLVPVALGEGEVAAIALRPLSALGDRVLLR